jgi:hypothetical protein
MDPAVIQDLIPHVIKILGEELTAEFGPQVATAAAEPLVSMRTLCKVHLNYPNVMTVEVLTNRLRKRVINR